MSAGRNGAEETAMEKQKTRGDAGGHPPVRSLRATAESPATADHSPGEAVFLAKRYAVPAGALMFLPAAVLNGAK